ncbi:MAG TPA: hypothetical protein VMW90_03160 [Acidobacteriota bacterium]|nr:hypothetical protein [Acidobacteriota bacterium]
MKIVNCPKGGRVPQGYCRESCLNYPDKAAKGKGVRVGKKRDFLISKRRSLLETYEGEISQRP